MPRVIQVKANKDELEPQYKQSLEANPLLARIEVQCKAVGWTDFEIRTFQLLTAVQSNASMSQRIQELEATIQKMVLKKGP
jgi:hypothetical protein